MVSVVFHVAGGDAIHIAEGGAFGCGDGGGHVQGRLASVVYFHVQFQFAGRLLLHVKGGFEVAFAAVVISGVAFQVYGAWRQAVVLQEGPHVAQLFQVRALLIFCRVEADGVAHQVVVSLFCDDDVVDHFGVDASDHAGVILDGYGEGIGILYVFVSAEVDHGDGSLPERDGIPCLGCAFGQDLVSSGHLGVGYVGSFDDEAVGAQDVGGGDCIGPVVYYDHSFRFDFVAV